MSLNILLTHSRLFKVIRNDTLEQDVCKSLLVGLSIETMSVPRTVSEIFNMKYKKKLSPLKMILFESFSYGFLFAFHSNYGLILYHV